MDILGSLKETTSARNCHDAKFLKAVQTETTLAGACINIITCCNCTLVDRVWCSNNHVSLELSSMLDPISSYFLEKVHWITVPWPDQNIIKKPNKHKQTISPKFYTLIHQHSIFLVKLGVIFTRCSATSGPSRKTPATKELWKGASTTSEEVGPGPNDPKGSRRMGLLSVVWCCMIL